MRYATTLLFAAAIGALTMLGGCQRVNTKLATNNDSISPSATPALYSAAMSAPQPAYQGQQGQQGQQAGLGRGDSSQTRRQDGQRSPDSLNAASSSQASAQAIERKIIRNAELILELDSPEEAQRRIAAIAEKHGGFIVNSESRQNDGNLQNAPRTTITIVARVPAAKFTETVEEIQRTGSRVLHRKDTGQDVTEEFIDLAARLSAKRALESQFLEIMKRAQKVSEALEVQTQLAEVRGEIERVEGRRRFLENQAALSTVTVRLQTPTPIIAATTGGFWHGIKLAFGDGLDTAAEIVLGLIRFVIVMIPVVLLIVLPLWLLARRLRRRVEWPKRAAVKVSE